MGSFRVSTFGSSGLGLESLSLELPRAFGWTIAACLASESLKMPAVFVRIVTLGSFYVCLI